MTEVAAETQATETETGEQDATTQTKPTETVEFWKQKAREQEGRAKANAEAATRLKEIEDAQKSAEERATEALSAADRRAQDAEARALRLEIAAENKMTPAQAKFLVGSTREELEASVIELRETFKPATEDIDETAAKVATSLDLGTRGTTTAATGDPAADFAKFLKGQTG